MNQNVSSDLAMFQETESFKYNIRFKKITDLASLFISLFIRLLCFKVFNLYLKNPFHILGEYSEEKLNFTVLLGNGRSSVLLEKTVL